MVRAKAWALARVVVASGQRHALLLARSKGRRSGGAGQHSRYSATCGRLCAALPPVAASKPRKHCKVFSQTRRQLGIAVSSSSSSPSSRSVGSSPSTLKPGPGPPSRVMVILRDVVRLRSAHGLSQPHASTRRLPRSTQISAWSSTLKMARNLAHQFLPQPAMQRHLHVSTRCRCMPSLITLCSIRQRMHTDTLPHDVVCGLLAPQELDMRTLRVACRRALQAIIRARCRAR
mmetsp:Transcript_44277/g.141716  ORF Transcript_44277/g.141716 Transcript_44277/m.141716 type:complete len:232 (-) Transcript_44277:908-1603(-)